MKRSSMLAAGGLVFALASCGAPNPTATSQDAAGQNDSAVDRAAQSAGELTAQTDARALVDACIAYVETGAQRDFTGLGYRRDLLSRGVGFTKESAFPVVIFTPKITSINITYSVPRSGSRLCEIDHRGARRGSGTEALVVDFVERMQQRGWQLSGGRTLVKDGQTITLRGQTRRTSSSITSEIDFRLDQ